MDENQSLRERVKAAIDALDPESLLAIGAPDDEYAPEAKDLAGQIERGVPMTLEGVTATWRRWFGDRGRAIGRPDVMSRLTSSLAAIADSAR